MIVDDIREHLRTYLKDSVFSYGRPFDTALASATIKIDEWFVHLDPVTFEGIADDTEKCKLSIGFLLQDKPDAEFDADENLDINDSTEEIQWLGKVKALAWLNDFLDNYTFSGSTYTITPVTRIKNVMSGALLNVTLSYKPTC